VSKLGRCEVVVSVSPETGEEKECGKPGAAMHKGHWPICADCIEDYKRECVLELESETEVSEP